jgi:predicted ATPase
MPISFRGANGTCASIIVITSLTVENWKSLESAVLNIDALTVLIGTNASGKSNVLDALSFLNRISTGVQLTAALQGDGANPALRGGVEWAARKPGDRFSLTIVLRANDTTDYSYRLECRTGQNRCELTSEQLDRIKHRLDKNNARKGQAGRISLFRTDPVPSESPTIIARLYNEKRGTPRQVSRASAALFQLYGQKLRSEIQEGVDSVVGALRSIFILDPIPSHMRAFSLLSDHLDADAGNIAGVLAALSDDLKSSIESTLTKYASRLPERDVAKVWAETVGKFNTDAMLYCEEHLGKDKTAHVVDARGMSDGTLRFLAILTALLTRPEGSLLVVEEVDNGLHPSRSSLLLEMLADVGRHRSVDVVVTTHNPALLDAMGTRMVPFITVVHRDPTNGVSKLTLLEDVAQLPKLLAQGPVGRLSSQGLIESALQQQSGGGA